MNYTEVFYTIMNNHRLKYLIFVINFLGLIQFIKSESGLEKITLTTKRSPECGGFYIFAQICRENDCCEDEIVKNENVGFRGGHTIEATLENCVDFLVSPRDDLKIKLTSWKESTVSFDYDTVG